MKNIDDNLQEIVSNGYSIIRGAISEENLREIDKEFTSFHNYSPKKNVNFFSTIFRKSIYRLESHFVPAISKTATKSIINSPLMRIGEIFYKETPIISEFDYRKTTGVSRNTIVKTHYDHNESFLYALTTLRDINKESGPTYLFSNTHTLKHDSKTNYQDFESFSKNIRNPKLVICDDLKAGDMLIFDTKILHGRMPAIKPGRELFFTKILPVSSKKITNLLYSSETLNFLEKDDFKYLFNTQISEQLSNDQIIFENSGAKSTIPIIDALNDLIHIISLKLKTGILYLKNRKFETNSYPKIEDLF